MGKRLLEMPGHRFQAVALCLPRPTCPPLAGGRDCYGRADCESVIPELRAGFALPALGLDKFRYREVALSLATRTYNLTLLFQPHLGRQQKVTIHSLRFWRLATAGESHPGGKTTVKRAVAGAGARLVAAISGKDLESLTQRQCGGKPSRFKRLNHPKINSDYMAPAQAAFRRWTDNRSPHCCYRTDRKPRVGGANRAGSLVGRCVCGQTPTPAASARCADGPQCASGN